MFAPQDHQDWKWPEPMDNAQARCADGTGALLDLFFSEQLADIAAAKAICAQCPVRVPCLAGALARREPWGVWGGELLAQGKILAHKRGRGRPRKVRPEEAGVPATRTA